MRRLMNMIMLSCRKVTELIEMQKHCPLSFKDSIQLRMHLFVCKYCSRYVRQVELIDKAVNKTFLDQDTSEFEENVIQQLSR